MHETKQFVCKFEHQIIGAPSYLTTFNTPYGRYRYLRLPFGLIRSQDEFQPKSEEAFERLEGFAAIVDDILVYG